MKSIDLSIKIEPGVSVDIRTAAPVIHYTKHTDDASLAGMTNVFAGAKREDFEPYGWASERVCISTHTGTHMNAPWHFWPCSKDGTPAKHIDEFPLEWGIQQGVILNFESLPDGSELTLPILKEMVYKQGVSLEQKTVLLYFGGSCGSGPRVHLTAEALAWMCIEKGVHVVGTEAASLTCASYIDKCSQLCGENSVFVIENIAGLSKLPDAPFKVVCFPQKVKDGSAAWCRVLAVF